MSYNIEDFPPEIQKQIREQLGETEKKKSKYKNQITRIDGKTFDSKHEAERYQELTMLEKAGEITALQHHVKFKIEDANEKNREAYYEADFVYFDYRRGWIVEDAKGFRTKDYKLKKKAMYNRYGIDIQEV